jgi:RNA polymerase sigma factor for flagellar operon FliA
MSKSAATISSECSALDVLERQEVLSLLAQKMAKLPERQKKILAMYYHEKKQLSEIATCFGLTEGLTAQIHTQAVDLLRNYLGSILA